MEQNQSHNELNNDQKLAEQLFSKESLSQFNENALETPHFYFENFISFSKIYLVMVFSDIIQFKY